MTSFMHHSDVRQMLLWPSGKLVSMADASHLLWAGVEITDEFECLTTWEQTCSQCQVSESCAA